MRKLSEIKGEETLDVIAEIVDPIANIAMDKDASELFERKKVPEGMTPYSFTAQRIKKAVPALIRSHKMDLVHILSTMAGIKDEEYIKDMSIASLISDVLELTNDPDFMQLFH